MPDSSAAMAPRESCQRDFSHGLQEKRTAKEMLMLQLLPANSANSSF
jgi:hypothetical protein